jgi:hypothetical protein
MQSQLNSISDKVLSILLLAAAVLAPWMLGSTSMVPAWTLNA